MAKKSMQQLGKELAKDHTDLSPDEQPLGDNRLSHDENLRGTALSLACRYYVETIVKDGDLYREMVRDNRVLKPATYVGVIDVACSFEMFIRGELRKDADAVVGDATEMEAAVKERKLEHEKHMKELDDLTKEARETPVAK